MKIYTKGGDKGSTSLLSGERVKKNHKRIEAYGTVDELNSFVGLLLSELTDPDHRNFLTKVQHQLFNIGSHLAVQKEVNFELPRLSESFAADTEAEIDRLNQDLPPLKNFILPGSSRPGAIAHVCRSICRRAERRVLDLPESEQITHLIIPYLNRLSDYFFVLARSLNKADNSPEQIWKK